jgi:hypothetical protein
MTEVVTVKRGRKAGGSLESSNMANTAIMIESSWCCQARNPCDLLGRVFVVGSM